MLTILPFKLLQHSKEYMIHQLLVSNLKTFHKIKTLVHEPNIVYPEPSCHIERPWYRNHENIHQFFVLQGHQYIDFYCLNEKKKEQYFITPRRVYRNNRLYYDCPSLIQIHAGIFYRIITGSTGSISIHLTNESYPYNVNEKTWNEDNIYKVDTKHHVYYLLKSPSSQNYNEKNKRSICHL